MPTAVDTIIGNPTVVQFAPNQNVQQQLQNNFAMEFLRFRLTGNLALSGYGSAPNKYVESLENLIQSFTLQATGATASATSDQLCNVDGPFLRFKERMMEGTDVVRTDIGTANGTYEFETNLTRYFCDPRSNASRLTNLFTSLLSTLTAGFQFRDATAMLYGGSGGSATLSGVQITTQARQYLGGTPPTPSPYVKETQRSYNVVTQTNLFPALNVPLGNVLRRQYFKGMVGAVPYADPSDSFFGASGKPEGPHIQLVLNNTLTKIDQVYQQLRADNKSLFGVETMPAGYAIYEPARNRALKNSIPLAGVGSAQNNVDAAFVSGQLNTLQITDEQIIGLSAAQFNASR